MVDDTKTYQVKVNEFMFSFSRSEIEGMDLVQLSSTEFNLIKNNQSVQANLVDADTSGKKLKVEIAGEVFDVTIKDELDEVLETMGFGTVSNQQIKEIRAPMPGLVLEVSVTEGQEVQEGEKMLVLAAMKMENSILTHTNAKIKRVAISAGQAVEKGQVLIELE
jgi:biotin carboxyl carrier protein